MNLPLHPEMLTLETSQRMRRPGKALFIAMPDFHQWSGSKSKILPLIFASDT